MKHINHEIIQLSGTMFMPGVSARVNGSPVVGEPAEPVATTYTSSTMLNITIPPAMLTLARSLVITAQNPDPAVYSHSSVSLVVINPVPALQALSPTVLAVLQTTTLTLRGEKFVPEAIAHVGGVTVSTNILSSTEAQIQIPGGIIPVAGKYAIDIVNPAVIGLGGGSDTLHIPVIPPVPALDSISPALAQAGMGDVGIYLYGSGFTPASVVRTNGVVVSKTFLATNSLLVNIPSALCTSAATVMVQVENPGALIDSAVMGGGLTVSLPLKLINPAPVITAITPDHGFITSPTPVTVWGTGFIPTTLVEIRDSAATTVLWTTTATLNSYSSFGFTLPAGVLLPGVYAVVVKNPATDTTDGGESLPVLFEMRNPAATLLSVSPDTLTRHQPGVTLTLLGTDFVTTATVFVGDVALLPTFVSSTMLTVVVPAQNLNVSGLVEIKVWHPRIENGGSTGSPTGGGGYSNAINLLINNPEPKLLALTPQQLTATADAVQINLTGTGFVMGMTAEINGVPANLTDLTDTTAILNIPANTLMLAGNYSVTLQNPAPYALTGMTTGTFTIMPGAAVQAEFGDVSATLTAGTALPAFTVSYKDQYGNLTDFEGSVGYGNVQTTSTSTGTITLTRTVLGVSTATQVVFNQTGDYTLTTGLVTEQGNRAIAVLPDTLPHGVVVTGFPETLTAGDNLPAFTLNFTDVFQNAMDAAAYSDKLFLLINPFGSSETYRINLPASQSPLGTLTTLAMQVTTAGTYSLVVDGLADSLISGTKSLVVSPGAITQIEFEGVPANVTAGQALPAFTVKYWDAFQNPVDTDTGVTFTNMDNTSTGTISLTRTALGVSTATQAVFTYAGNYTLAVDGIVSTIGNTSIQVFPSPATLASFSGFPTTLTAGSSIPVFSVQFYDTQGNLINFSGKLYLIYESHDVVDSISLEPQSEGMYLTTAPMPILMKSGSYQIVAANGDTVLGASGNNECDITPTSPVKATFSGLKRVVIPGSGDCPKLS